MSLICLAQDSDTRDFSVVAGRLQFLSGVDAAMQIIDNTMRSQLGEYKYDQTAGLDYSGNLFGADPNYQLFEARARSAVKALSFVTSIDDFTYEFDADTYIFSYDMTVTTDYGTGTTGSTTDTTAATVSQITTALIVTQKYVAAGMNYATKFEV